LALQLKNNQLGLYSVIVLLISISAIGLFVRYREQRQTKQKPIEQNTLIQSQATQLSALDALVRKTNLGDIPITG
jgi:heme/copper-type cytochrome/quinol oxidase subunit 2